MPSYLITGTSRGLGLAIAEELLEDPNNVVVATARDISAPGLKALASKTPKDRLHLVLLEVSKEDAYLAAVTGTEAALPNGLDYLIVNAGARLSERKCSDFKLFEEELRINFIAPMITVRAFTPLLNKGSAKKVLFMASTLGSFNRAANPRGLADTYSTTKAALNMAVLKYGTGLKAQGSDLIFDWSATDLGAGVLPYSEKYIPNFKTITLEESVNGSIKVLHHATKEDDTKFINWKGEHLPW